MDMKLQMKVGGRWEEVVVTHFRGSLYISRPTEVEPFLEVDGVEATEWLQCSDEDGEGRPCMNFHHRGQDYLFSAPGMDIEQWLNHFAKEEETASLSKEEEPLKHAEDKDEPLMPIAFYGSDLESGSGSLATSDQSGINFFGWLPRDVMLYLWGFLGFRELVAVTKTSKHFRDTARTMPLMYAERERWKRRRRAERMEWLFKQIRKLLFVVFFNRVWEMMLAINLAWICIMTPLKVEKVVEWPWVFILLPCYFQVVQMMLSLPMYHVVEYKFDRTRMEFRKRGIDAHMMEFAVVGLLGDVKKKGLKGFFWFYSNLEGVGLWLLLSMLALSGVPIPWTVAMLPIAYVAVVNTIYIARFPNSSNTIDRATSGLVLILLALFFLSLGAKVDGYVDFLSWYVIMGPLFFVEFMSIAIPPLFSLLAKRSFYFRMSSKWNVHNTRFAKLLLIHFGLFWAAIGVFCVPFIVQMLVLQRLEENSTIHYSLIFIPIYLLNLIVLIGCCGMMVKRKQWLKS